MRIYKSLVTVDFERDDNQMTKQNKVKVFVAYLIAFFSLWALVELVLFEKITSVVGNGVLSEFIREGVIKNLVWTVPAGVLIYRFKDEVLSL